MSEYADVSRVNLIEDFDRIVDEVFAIFEKADIPLTREQIILAGGYCRDKANGETNPPKDIDVFLPTEIVKAAMAKLMTMRRINRSFEIVGFVRYDGDRYILQYTPENKDWPIIQLISTDEVGLIANLDRFDWNICKIGYDPVEKKVLAVNTVFHFCNMTTDRMGDCRRTLMRGFQFEKKYGGRMADESLYRLAKGLADETAKKHPNLK